MCEHRPMNTSSRRAHGLLALLAFLSCFVLLAGTPAVAGEAAVATSERHATETAIAVLSSGGNAVDAAVATAFVLAVTYPEAGNIGGGGFATLTRGGEAKFLDFRETAPRAATRDMYLDANGKVVPDSSLVGHRAAGVPGTVAGLWELHRQHGSKPWRELLQPAIRLAREGFVPPPQLIARTTEKARSVKERTNFAAHFGALAADKPFVQADLARTLERIAARGPNGFYRGETAKLVAAEMKRGGGLITEADLRDYKPVWRTPLRTNWRKYEIVTAPPPSSGGIALVQLLRMKDALAPRFEGIAHNSGQYVHLVAEMEKRVFADRAQYLGDPDFVKVPVERLTDPQYLARRASEVDPGGISKLANIRPGLPESLETTHFAIVDGAGDAVAITYTLNGSFGNAVVVGGAGFLLNNEMDDFSIKPGEQNFYGVVGGSANEIAPGKRMLSSMTPTILLQDGKVHMVIGTPGGSTIFTSVFQGIVNVEDFGMTPLQAVGAARFHHQLLPPTRIVYSRCCSLPEAALAELRSRGYDMVRNPWEFGDLQLIRYDANGKAEAASDPRGRGTSQVISLPERKQR